MNLQTFANEVHTHNVNVGWWDGDPCIYEKLQLISTEIAEATEGGRKDLMDDKLPHRKMGEVELADALIRTIDLGERLELELTADNILRGRLDCVNHCRKLGIPDNVAAMHMVLNLFLSEWCHDVEPGDIASEYHYGGLVGAILSASEHLSYDIYAAAREKFEFNKTRADHKRENRAAKHGKKF